MACENCGPDKDGSKSCGSGSCGSSCGSGAGHGKLDVFDWLSNMRLPNGQQKFDCVEVRFKNDRKGFFKNTNNLSLYVGDTIAVEAQSGHDIGVVTLTGELVRIQMKKKKVSINSESVLKIYRKATQKDIEVWQAAREKEETLKIRSRKIARGLGLEMKISDVEFQGDGTKAIFYYTAEGRVDFRQLIKDFASEYRIRIEMKQIGYRQEAAKVGGISSSGRELCSSTWLTDFRSVSTSAARYQQLAINPQKLAGQCGKLKCCLNYELDSYLDALKDFPEMEKTFETVSGTAGCVKIDVFKKELWYAYQNNHGGGWFKFPLEAVKIFMKEGNNGGKTASLEDLAKDLTEEVKRDFIDVIQESSLERFEQKKFKNKKNNRNRKPESKQIRPKQDNNHTEIKKETPKDKIHSGRENKHSGKENSHSGNDKGNSGRDNRPKNRSKESGEKNHKKFNNKNKGENRPSSNQKDENR